MLKLSKVEAARLGHNYIGPEHYLLAIIKKGDGIAIEVLDKLGIDPAAIKLTVEQSVERGNTTSQEDLRAPDARAKEVLDGARAEANFFKHGWVGTEHFLLALIKEEELVTSKCLRSLGLDYAKVQRAVVEAIEGGSSAKVQKKTPLPFNNEVRVIMDLAQAFALEHEHGHVTVQDLFQALGKYFLRI